MKQYFYSHGKLLLTGEYFVLDGAQALALPCKFGQSLHVHPTNTKGISWISYDINKAIWFQHHFSLEDILQKPVSHPKSIVETLQKILYFTYCKKPDFFTDLAVACETTLEFPRDWGLGSSSTLINNIALWTDSNAYELLESSFGGSGYDIAAAQSETSFIYQRYPTPTRQEVSLKWNFTEAIFFVHRNQKQDSKEGIARYIARTDADSDKIKTINKLTEDFIHADSLERLSIAMNKHESIIGEHIGLPPIKEELFPDYPYAIKSLGAWGGDFIMAIGGANEMKYFEEKGYSTILPYSDMIL